MMPENDVVFEEAATTPSVCALIVNDRNTVGQGLAAAITALGVESVICASAKIAIAALDQHQPNIIFLDLSLHQSEAISFLESLRARAFDGIVQLMSGGGRLQLANLMQQIGDGGGLRLRPLLPRPYRLADIRAAISDAAALGRVVVPGP
jgi:ActR/RegA family two-component response regulator